MSAAAYLANFGVTMAQAREFIDSHMHQPQVIFETARQYGLTNDMLGEIAGGYSGDQVEQFFNSQGFSGWQLDAQPLFPEEIALLDRIVAFDTSPGILSLTSLREQVTARTGQVAYQAAFDPNRFPGAGDGVFTTAELGTAVLGNVAATRENIESIFYGTIIRLASTIDVEEAMQLDSFLSAHWDHMDDDPVLEQQFMTLMLGVIEDDAASPYLSESMLAEAAVGSGVAIVQMSAQGQQGLFDELLTGFL